MGVKVIPLPRGFQCVVDASDYEGLSKYKWHRRHGYVVRTGWVEDRKRRAVYMHHCVIGYPLRGKVVDHIDGDQLNNTKANLRIVTMRENQGNRKERREGKTASRFVGVRWDKTAKKWRACIGHNGKTKHLGLFVDESAASVAYETAKRCLTWT